MCGGELAAHLCREIEGQQRVGARREGAKARAHGILVFPVLELSVAGACGGEGRACHILVFPLLEHVAASSWRHGAVEFRVVRRVGKGLQAV